MDRHERRLKQLAIIARDVLPIGSARIASAIYYRGQLVGLGTNKKKSHPFQAKWGRREECIYLHAEIEAIKNSINRMGGIDFFKESTIYVVRQKVINGQWVDGLAKPCAGCQRAIESFGLREVIYSENGRI